MSSTYGRVASAAPPWSTLSAWWTSGCRRKNISMNIFYLECKLLDILLSADLILSRCRFLISFW
jgi:hypothetical protein